MDDVGNTIDFSGIQVIERAAMEQVLAKIQRERGTSSSNTDLAVPAPVVS
jgi:hypothetical protein